MRTLCFGEILFDEIEGVLHLGGAPFNLAAHLAKLGTESYMVSSVGADKPGQDALQKAKELGVKTDFIQIDEQHQTGLVKVKVDEKGIPSYDIIEDTAYDNIQLGNDQLEKMSNPEFDCLCFGTLVQRNAVSRNALNALLKNVQAKQVFYDLNLRQNYFSKEIIKNSLERSSILKINDEEAEQLNELLYQEENDFRQLAHLLMKDFSLGVVIVTQGEQGCLAFSREQEVDIPGIKTKVADTVGAGDAFSASFLMEYLQGKDLKTACETANQLGAKVASQSGAV